MFKIGNSICTIGSQGVSGTYNQGLYHGGVTSALYKTVNYTDGYRNYSNSFYKYDLYNAVQSTGLLPSSINVPQNNNHNEYGYRVIGSQYDNDLGTINFENDPPYGLYLDNCYNKNFATKTIDVDMHASITMENNCLANISGTMNFENIDEANPVYFGDDCCPHMDFSAINNAYITRIGSRSFRNLRFGNDIKICEIAPDAGVNMTQPMTFGNMPYILFDLRPFIEAHSARCNDLGIKVISITGNSPYILNANAIRDNYAYRSSIDFDWNGYTNLTLT